MKHVQPTQPHDAKQDGPDAYDPRFPSLHHLQEHTQRHRVAALENILGKNSVDLDHEDWDVLLAATDCLTKAQAWRQGQGGLPGDPLDVDYRDERSEAAEAEQTGPAHILAKSLLRADQSRIVEYRLGIDEWHAKGLAAYMLHNGLGSILKVSLPAEEEAPEDAAPMILTWAEYKALAGAELDNSYVVPKLYRRGQSSLLCGEPKVGKSSLCRRLAVACAQGGRVLGYRVEATPVVYMALQEDPQHVVREIETLHPDDRDPGLLFYTHNPDAAMDWDRLSHAVKGIEAGMVVVDMVSDFKTWTDGNDYDEMKATIGRFTKLARDTKAHVLLVHHGSKAPTASHPTARVLGSTAISGGVDVVASIHRHNGKRIYQAEGRGIAPFTRDL